MRYYPNDGFVYGLYDAEKGSMGGLLPTCTMFKCPLSL